MKEIKKIANSESSTPKDSLKNEKDTSLDYSPTDVYYNTEKKIPDSGVAIPTYDAVLEAKEWVDDENKK